jgi:proteasome accessory factor B
VARKTERLLNLLIMLLAQSRYVSRDRIREILYPDQSADAFDKMFERDKEELRSLGVPIEMGTLDRFFEDEVGYRIRPDALALPEVSLTPEEAAVVGLAGRVWEHATLAEATTEAIRKLTAYGVPVDTAPLGLAAARVGAEEPAFDVLWTAAIERTPVEFSYSRGGQPPTLRRVQPWGVVRFSGRWYVVGHDTDRDDERVFRLSRISGTARVTGRPGSYTVPEGTDIRAVAQRLARPAPAEPATVLARAGTCLPLRRQATDVVPADAPPGSAADDLWDRLTLPAGSWTTDELMSFGADLVVEGPAALRADVVARLRALAEGAV